jgi:hypothetical protein
MKKRVSARKDFKIATGNGYKSVAKHSAVKGGKRKARKR